MLGGILAGSLTGSIMDFPRYYGWWDGVLIIIFVVGSERITRRTHKDKREKTLTIFVLQIGKMGMMRAFFRDAFKVGSSTTCTVVFLYYFLKNR